MNFVIQNSIWLYVLFFLILFFETWVSVTAFLPGDAILFGMGVLAAFNNTVNAWVMFLILLVAVILSDSINYNLGRVFSKKLAGNEQIPFFKMKQIAETQKFFKSHGEKTIIMARFLPVIRTVAPFISGATQMRYSKFIMYNFISGLLWVCAGFGVGYFLGNINVLRDNFSIIIIIFLLVLLAPPLIINFVKKRNYT